MDTDARVSAPETLVGRLLCDVERIVEIVASMTGDEELRRHYEELRHRRADDQRWREFLNEHDELADEGSTDAS